MNNVETTAGGTAYYSASPTLMEEEDHGNVYLSHPSFNGHYITVPSSRFPSNPQTLREHLTLFLDDPQSSVSAKVFAAMIAGLIVGNTVSTLVRSIPQFYGWPWWGALQLGFMTAFLVELLIRCFAHSSSVNSFYHSVLGSMTMWLDLAAIGPYLVSFFNSAKFGSVWHPLDMHYLSNLRLFRLFTMIHAFIRSDTLRTYLHAFVLAMKRSKMSLVLIATFQGILILVFSTLLHLVERGEWHVNNDGHGMFLDPKTREPSHFNSIPAACWFVAEVITTVGLGDVWPRTVLGKIISFPLMLFGLLVIVMPSIVIGQNFGEAWAWLSSLPPTIKQQMHRMSVIEPRGEKTEKLTISEPAIQETQNQSQQRQQSLTLKQQVELYDMVRQLYNRLLVNNLLREQTSFSSQEPI